MSERRVSRESFSLQNASGDTICGDLRGIPGSQKLPVVIICHSFMAFKDWGFFPFVAESLAASGFLSVIFNFSFNGVEPDQNRITDFKRFERNTFTREVGDLKTILDAIESGRLGNGSVDNSKVGILGHSRGGGIAIVAAAMDHRVRSLVTWSAISTFDRWTDHQKSAWRVSGNLPLSRHSSFSPLKLGLDLLTDIETNSQNLDILTSASQIDVPWLIIHGSADVIVPSREAEALFHRARRGTARLEILEHVGHLYNARSPEEDQYQTLGVLMSKTTEWFHQSLS